VLRQQVSYCNIDFDGASDSLSLKAHGPLSGRYRKLGTKKVTSEEIQKACDKYWEFVDTAIIAKDLSGKDSKKVSKFFDELKTHGNILCNKLLDLSTRRELWTVAKQSETVVLLTGLLQVPWEALYNPEANPNSFLSDNCVVIRWPEDTGDHSWGVTVPPDFARERMVCVDGLLKIDGCLVKDILTQDGEVVYVTSQKGELVHQIKEVRLVHWICEHDKQRGLRLDEDVYYTAHNSATHRFPAGSILVLTSCASGATSVPETSIAAGICVASNCTVIAPSSVVAAGAGVAFARKMNEVIKASAGPLRVTDLWSTIKGSSVELREQGKPPTVQTCYALWYGIYGNGEAYVLFPKVTGEETPCSL
jgi:hypothetical protein